MRTWPVIEQLAHRVETESALDRPAHVLATALRRVVRPGPVEDVLTGTTLGHPLHPVLIAFPIGSWAAATVLDVARADRDARRMLVGLGVLAAMPTALAGASDWLTTTGAARRLGLAHAVSTRDCEGGAREVPGECVVQAAADVVGRTSVSRTTKPSRRARL
jgi:hypothetical protein